MASDAAGIVRNVGALWFSIITAQMFGRKIAGPYAVWPSGNPLARRRPLGSRCGRCTEWPTEPRPRPRGEAVNAVSSFSGKLQG